MLRPQQGVCLCDSISPAERRKVLLYPSGAMKPLQPICEAVARCSLPHCRSRKGHSGHNYKLLVTHGASPQNLQARPRGYKGVSKIYLISCGDKMTLSAMTPAMNGNIRGTYHRSTDGHMTGNDTQLRVSSVISGWRSRNSSACEGPTSRGVKDPATWRSMWV
jgi:hypothetical protein